MRRVALASDRPHILGGRFEPGRAVVDHEDRWRIGAADDHQRIEAGLLPRDGEVRRREGVAEPVGERRLGGDRELAEVVSGVPTSGLKTKTSGFVGSERVNARRTFAMQQPRRQADAAEEPAQHVLGSGIRTPTPVVASIRRYRP